MLLTGALDDGAAGIVAIKAAGGVTIVQDPEEAFSPGMPRSAIATGSVDHVLPIRDIPVLLTALVEEQAPASRATPDHPHLRRMEPDLGRCRSHCAARTGRESRRCSRVRNVTERCGRPTKRD